MNKIKGLFREAVLLERSVPGIISALFILSIVAMNLLANKSISLPFDWLALDCGIIFSWLTFLLMDMVTKHFGPRAANMLSVIALLVNLFMALMLFIGSLIPGLWGESFIDAGMVTAAGAAQGEEFVEAGSVLINNALDHTFRGTWYVLMGSSIAFIISAFVNNEINWLIGRAAKEKNNFGVFAIRSYVSTFIAQFIDNLVFALIVSHNFFGWTLTQCFMCALTGAVIELLCEIIFSPIGYRVAKRWQKNGVGSNYIEWQNSRVSKA